MARGGKRIGAGRKPTLTKAVKELDTIKYELNKNHFIAAARLAESIPLLTQQAIEIARGGNVLMLKFLLEHFWHIVGALPDEGNTKYVELRAKIAAVVDSYQRPADVAADSTSPIGVIELTAHPSDA